MWRALCLAVAVLSSGAVWAQAPPGPVYPVPIPGGDVVPPFINIFSPGVPAPGAFFDGVNAEPNVITNFNGAAAMGYTLGVATDNAGNSYQVITDIRVYQGYYVGGQGTFQGGGTTSGKAFGTFIEI